MEVEAHCEPYRYVLNVVRYPLERNRSFDTLDPWCS